MGLGGELIDVAEATEDQLAAADLLVLGTSTWGDGDLQDDWEAFVDTLKSMDLSGKKVALFGLGDQCGFGSTFVDGMALLYEAVSAAGAEVIGATSSKGYVHQESLAEAGGMFAGLALDEDCQSELTAPRIADWVEVISQAL